MKWLLLCSALLLACSAKRDESETTRSRNPKRAVALVYRVADAPDGGTAGEAIRREILETVRARLTSLGLEAEFSWTGSRLHIALADPSEDELSRARMSIRGGGQLEIRLVIANHPVMLELIRWAHTQEQAKATDVRREIDHWNGRAGRSSDDNYLSAPSAEAITSLLSRHPDIDAIPRDLSIVYEKVYQELSPGLRNRQARWRSYLVGERARVRGHIRDTRVDNDPRSNQPYVEITLDDDGRASFAELTTRNVGNKLAIIIDGTVNSAPVIADPITAGKLWITMGGNDYRRSLEEARALASSLRTATLPAPLQLMSVTEVELP